MKSKEIASKLEQEKIVYVVPFRILKRHLTTKQREE